MGELLGTIITIGAVAGLALIGEWVTLAITNEQMRRQLAKARRQGYHVRRLGCK
jgi:hypothetical protein